MDPNINYFLNDGHIVFNPLDMFGLHGIYPKTMQHSFLDFRANTHSVESDFSLFTCKDQNTSVNFKNNFSKHGGMELPVGNSLSKLIGGFIGSKCLLGADRTGPFWGKVLQQYNILTNNSQTCLGLPTMKVKENFGDNMKASIVDAAVLISHSFGMMCREEIPKKEEVKSEDLSFRLKQPTKCTDKQDHEIKGEVTSKQSYADVAKSMVVNHSCKSLPQKIRLNKRRVQPANQTPFNPPSQKNDLDHISQNVKCWRKRSDSNNHHKRQAYYADTATGICKKNDITWKHSSPKISNGVSQNHKTNSVKSPKISKGVSENHKTNPLKSKQFHQHSNNRKIPPKHRASADLLNDIKEDYKNMTKEKESFQKDRLNSNVTSSDLFNSCDSNFATNRCMNWRCRPNISLCETCKMSSFHSPPDHPQSLSEEVLICGADEETESEISVSTSPDTDFSPGLDLPARVSSMAVAESSTVVRARLSSECSVDSEDSFIIMFDASVNCSDGEEESSETSSDYSDSDDDDSESITSDNDSEEDDASIISSQCSNLAAEDNCENDECDFALECSETKTDSIDLGCVADKLREANTLWESAYENIPAVEKKSQKVQFAESQKLATVHPILAWDFAYRAARRGPWEQLGRDRVRFQTRIDQMNKILGPVLTEAHRRHIWQKLYSQMQEIT